MPLALPSRLRALPARVLALILALAAPAADLRSPFDLHRYPQRLEGYTHLDAPGPDQPLLSAERQAAGLKDLLARQVGERSPWSRAQVQALLDRRGPDRIRARQEALLLSHDNRDKAPGERGHGLHYRPHPQGWTAPLADRMQLAQLEAHRTFQPERCAIATTNLHCRLLPTDEPVFGSQDQPGEGYPFDRLQHSAVWAGTALYRLGETTDGLWSLVLTPDVTGWIHTEGLARVDRAFMIRHREALGRAPMALLRPDTAVRGTAGQLLFTAYPGTLLPGGKEPGTLWVPQPDGAGRARHVVAQVAPDGVGRIPLAPTPRQFTQLMASFLGRPYGWGNMGFWNDCSAELKALFLPFGLYLPRNSADQASAGRTVDLSERSPQARVDFLLREGRPFLTLVTLPGHVMLHLGGVSLEGRTVPLTFQNLWALSPPDRSRRAILGGSVLFPLCETYPEDPSLQSLAAKSRFLVTFLDEAP